MDKRDFIKNTAGLMLAPLAFNDLRKLVDGLESDRGYHDSTQESFWSQIREGYELTDQYINLENGYFCISPKVILEAYQKHLRMINYEGSFYMRNRCYEDKQEVSSKLANLLGSEPEELIITRNTTESLDTVISGYSWQEGDEAIWSVHDYGAMQNQFRLMERRWGIENKVVTVPLHPQSDEEIVEVYRKAISPKTKLLMVCHMINITGHVLPIRKICDMAHEHGVDVMVDGAHTFAHLNFKISDLNCDYYGASLHKWLSAPIGSGILYVKKEKIKKVWPMFADSRTEENDILKLNHTGTHPPHTDLAIVNAINYFNILGSQRKENRLRYLQRYWTDQVREHPNIVLNTPSEEQRSCAIANVGIKGMKPSDMSKTLLDQYGIWTVAIDHAGVHGCRITPNIYSTTEELDQFVKALKTMA